MKATLFSLLLLLTPVDDAVALSTPERPRGAPAPSPFPARIARPLQLPLCGPRAGTLPPHPAPDLLYTLMSLQR
jgi:hypothetical protein